MLLGIVLYLFIPTINRNCGRYCNPKAVSILMGHAKEIITVDIYGDHKALMVDCTKEIDMFLEELCLSDQNDQTLK